MTRFYFTETGWPNAESREKRDWQMVMRAAAIVRATRLASAMSELKSILDLSVEDEIYDVRLPLTQRQREDMHWVYGPSFSVISGDRLVLSLEATMRDASLRSTATVGQRTCLYRLRDDSCRLLYVGIAYNPDEREKQHRHSQRWAPLIADREDEWFDSREEALRAETHAIRNEGPLFNEAGRPSLPSLTGEAL